VRVNGPFRLVGRGGKHLRAAEIKNSRLIHKEIIAIDRRTLTGFKLLFGYSGDGKAMLCVELAFVGNDVRVLVTRIASFDYASQCAALKASKCIAIEVPEVIVVTCDGASREAEGQPFQWPELNMPAYIIAHGIVFHEGLECARHRV